MLRGIIERRLSPRVPYQSEILIRFEKNQQELISTTAVNISAGGIQFTLPWGFQLSQEGELVEIIFELPLLGTTKVIGEIRHLQLGIDTDLNRIVYYGIRFLDLSPETWTYIYDYCQSKFNPQSEMDSFIPHNKIQYERKDFRVEINLAAVFIRPNAPALTGKIEDISYGGIKALVPMRFSKDEAVTVQLQFENAPIELSGNCVWCDAILGQRFPYCIGISFDNLDAVNFKVVRNLMFSAAG